MDFTRYGKCVVEQTGNIFKTMKEKMHERRQQEDSQDQTKRKRKKQRENLKPEISDLSQKETIPSRTEPKQRDRNSNSGSKSK